MNYISKKAHKHEMGIQIMDISFIIEVASFSIIQRNSIRFNRH